MADEAPAQLTLDQELEALAPAKETPPAAVAIPAVSPDTDHPTGEPPAGESEVKPLEEQLKEIPDETPPETPKLPEAQQKILDTFKTPEEAQEASRGNAIYKELDTALASGNYDLVDQLFAPEAHEGYLNHIYEKYVQSGEWVDRWIAEKEGTVPVHTGLKQMQNRIAQLEAERQREKQGQTTHQQQQRNAETNKAFSGHLESLFDKISFSEKDRRWVAADITNRIAQDKTAMEAYQNRNFGQLNKIFKTAVTEYVQRDQQIAKKTEQTVAAQESKKPLPQGSAITPTGPITDEQIKAAPKEKRAALYDRQMDEQLAQLARRK